MTADLQAKLSPEALKKIGGSDLAYDTKKLEQLAQIAADEQAIVLHRYRLGIPWEEALAGTPARSVEPVEHPGPRQHPPRTIERRKVSDLKANRFNSTLFPDSLSENSVALIADDFAKNGQRVPVEITPDNTVVDGERRWRGAQRLGWEGIDVIVTADLTDDQILDRVIDACTSSRQMSIREQVNVYRVVCEQLKREAGRQARRPKKVIPKGISYLTPRSMRDAAATRAGFTSTTLAVRAEAVFSRSPEDLQAQVREGTLTISAAYERLPKRSKRKAEPEIREETDLPDDQTAAPADGGMGNEAAPTLKNGPVAAAVAAPDEPGDRRPNESRGESDLVHGTDGYEPEEHTERGDPDDALLDSSDTSDSEQDEPHPDRHVSSVCRHIARLAERDYEEAVAWFDQVVEEMRASLGDPPQAEEGEQQVQDDGFDLLATFG